jgi:hypothetical protein
MGSDVGRGGWVAATAGLVAAVVLVAAALAPTGPDGGHRTDGATGTGPGGLAAPLGGPDVADLPAAPTTDGAAPPEDARRPDGFVAVTRRGRHDPALIVAIAADPRVVGMSRLRSDTLGLTEVIGPDGATVERYERGWRIPVSVTALDPALHTRVVGSESWDAAQLGLLGLLAPGTVLLSESGAVLRRVGAGATLTVAGRLDLSRARTLTVVGVVPDGLVNGAELAVHLTDADTLGLDTSEALLVRHRDDGPGADGSGAAARFAADVAALAGLRDGPGTTGPDELRVRPLGRAGGPRLVLGTVAVKERFGEFAYRPTPDVRDIVIDPAWVRANITTDRLPVIGAVTCHRLILDDLRAAVDDLVAAGFDEWLSPRRYAGCWWPRRIRTGRPALSRHAWGIALDLNVDLSQPGLGARPPDELIAIMGRHGFRWGGDFTEPDNHHWEWLGPGAEERPLRAG